MNCISSNPFEDSFYAVLEDGMAWQDTVRYDHSCHETVCHNCHETVGHVSTHLVYVSTALKRLSISSSNIKTKTRALQCHSSTLSPTTTSH